MFAYLTLGNLADLEEISATAGRKSCVDLFEEGIRSNKLHYNNMHVYPYTYYAGYLYRREEYREALKCWAEAAQVISQ
jgi:menin